MRYKFLFLLSGLFVLHFSNAFEYCDATPLWEQFKSKQSKIWADFHHYSLAEKNLEIKKLHHPLEVLQYSPEKIEFSYNPTVTLSNDTELAFHTRFYMGNGMNNTTRERSLSLVGIVKYNDDGSREGAQCVSYVSHENPSYGFNDVVDYLWVNESTDVIVSDFYHPLIYFYCMYKGGSEDYCKRSISLPFMYSYRDFLNSAGRVQYKLD